MEKMRDIKYRIKVVLLVIVIVIAMSYLKDYYFAIHGKSTLSKMHKIKAGRASDRSVTRNVMDSGSMKQSNIWDIGRNFAPKSESAKKELDRFPGMEKDKIVNNEKKSHESELNAVDNATPSAHNKTVKKSYNLINKNGMKWVTNKTSRRDKLSLQTVTKIVGEILDRMNISRSNNTSGKQFQQTNNLTHSEVGNISKEINQRNLSFIIANAVITFLSNGGVKTSRNVTLMNHLMQNYMNNTKSLKYSPNVKSSQKGQNMDKDQRLNANKQPMTFSNVPVQRGNKQGFRETGKAMSYKYNLQQPVVGNTNMQLGDKTQLGYKGQPQQTYRDQSAVKDGNLPKQRYVNKVGQDLNQRSQQEYRENQKKTRDGLMLPYGDRVQNPEGQGGNLPNKWKNQTPKIRDSLPAPRLSGDQRDNLRDDRKADNQQI